MDKFPHVPAPPGRVKKINGVAINDAPYVVAPTINGRKIKCPYYLVWKNMIRAIRTDDSAVCREWLGFMAFRAWMEQQKWKGRTLDKDILVAGAIRYSPMTCAFVWPATARLVTADHVMGTTRGVDQNMGRWRATYSGRLLGRYDTKTEARGVWRMARARALLAAAMVETDPRIPPRLVRYATELLAYD